MGIPGAGPSRRSHTKSRTGCKTCKRRHIRCDESFPQCKNCTKHQVRCDYQDTLPTSPQESAPSWLPTNPDIEALVEQWQRSGVASMGGFNVNLRAEGHLYSKTDLLLLYHGLLSASNPASHEYSVWSEMPPKFIRAAEQHPFLVHAINGFTGLGLAFESEAHEAKQAAYQQGGIALQGLQQAINNFSPENADAVFAASVLLSWQANDWHSWSSLASGIPTVIAAMHWRNDSELAGLIDEQESTIPLDFPKLARAPMTDETVRYHTSTLHQMSTALGELQAYVSDRPEDSAFIGRLKDYLQRLQSVRPAHTAEDQFNHLYAFRKWLFWMPGALLRSETKDFMTLTTLAHLYATALNLEPLYPNIAGPFCSAMVVKPLTEIFSVFDNLAQSAYPSEQFQFASQLLSYPRQAFQAYQSRKMMREASYPVRSPLTLDRVGSDIGHTAEHYRDHRSPAFGRPPTSLSYPSTTRSSSESPYLEVPHILPSQAYEYDTSSMSGSYDVDIDWAAGSSAFGHDDTAISPSSAGFVQPLALWSY